MQTGQQSRSFAAILGGLLLTILSFSRPTAAADLEGAASLIRPELSSLSVTDTVVNTVIKTNTELIAVGQIPVLATNIDYQLVITNPDVMQLFFDAIVLTNAVGTSGGDADPIFGFCDFIVLTNIVGTTTNLVPIGSLCVNNEYRTILIVTNTILDVQYYTLVSTNLIFDPADERCWQTIYHTNFTFEAVTTTNTTLTEFNFNFAGSPTARGQINLSASGNRQSFQVVARDLLTDAANPPAAMGVFLGDSVYNPVWQRVGILSKAGTNNLYKLDLSSPNGPPPSLGVGHIADLAGKLVQIRDQDTNVYAQAVIPVLVPSAGKTSYQRRVPMTRGASVPSPNATGAIRVRYNGVNGASLLQVDGRKLAPGNSYCAVYSLNPVYTGDPCLEGLPLVRGKGEDIYDTSRGDDLPFSIGTYVNDIRDLAGVHVYIVDAFGTVHLQGTIPGPK